MNAPPPAGEPQPISVIVPTLDEAANLPVLVDRLRGALTAEGRRFEVVIVDDDSPDGTATIARGLGPEVRVIGRPEAQGVASALLVGLRQAANDVCVCLDADLSHPPERVLDLVRAIEGGAPLAFARWTDGGDDPDPWHRLHRGLFAALARPLSGDARAATAMFCVRRDLAPLDRLDPVGHRLGLEILVKSGRGAPAQVDIAGASRTRGRSKLDADEVFHDLSHLGRLYRWRWPLATDFLLFAVVGAIGTVVDIATMSLFVEGLGVWFGWARIAGFVTAANSNFLLNDRFTFHGRGDAPRWVRHLRFLGISAAGMVVNFATSMALFYVHPMFQRFYPVAAALGVVAGTAVNFTGARWYAFRHPTPTS